MANTGDVFVKYMGKFIWWVITLLPTLFKLIYRGIVGVINLFRGNKTADNPTHLNADEEETRVYHPGDTKEKELV